MFHSAPVYALKCDTVHCRRSQRGQNLHLSSLTYLVLLVGIRELDVQESVIGMFLGTALQGQSGLFF